MAYVLFKDLTRVNYTKGNHGRKYLVIHYTGNRTDTAKNNANYFRSVNRGASAHYFVDEVSVYQVVEDANTSWAVGVNYGKNNLFGIVTNGNSISIEMCSTGGKIADATFANTVALTKALMAKYGIPASNVYRHWDVCSKLCPGWDGWLGSNPTLWNKFKSQIGGASVGGGNTSVGTGSKKSNETIANEVIAGKWGNGNDRKNRLSAAGYDYSAIQAIVNQKLSGKSTPSNKKSNETIANEVIAGKWGNGNDRKEKITAAGYNYSAVQALVNQKLMGKPSGKKSNDTIANEVIAGKWGNGNDRKNRLAAVGYDYSAIQSLVNKKLK